MLAVGATSGTALGRDDDNAVRRERAVDGAGRGTLQDFDVLDVRRVEVGDTVDRLVLAVRDAATGRGDGVQTVQDDGVADDHAVDDVERAGIGVDRRRAAELHLHTAAGAPEFCEITAPGILPWSAFSIVGVGALLSCSPLT